MKKVLACLFLAGLAATARAAGADCPTDGSKACVTLLDAVTTDIESSVYDLSGWNKVTVQISSSGPPVATFTLYCRNSDSDPWTVAFSIANPGPTEPPYYGPGACFCKGAISGWASGTFTATMKRTK